MIDNDIYIGCMIVQIISWCRLLFDWTAGKWISISLGWWVLSCVMTFLPLTSVTCSLMALTSFHTRVDMILLSLQGNLRGDVKASKATQWISNFPSSKGNWCFLAYSNLLICSFCASWAVKISEWINEKSMIQNSHIIARLMHIPCPVCTITIA